MRNYNNNNLKTKQNIINNGKKWKIIDFLLELKLFENISQRFDHLKIDLMLV
jgi:hypothetical protein